MNYKLLSLHIACSLLLTTGVAFGMEKESTNPEQQVYVVVNYINKETQEEEWLSYDTNGNKVPTNEAITHFSPTYTLEHNNKEQILRLNKPDVSLTDLRLSNEQMKIADAILKAKVSSVYVNVNGILLPLAEIKKTSYTRQRSHSNLGITRANSSTNIARNNNSNTDVQQEDGTQNTLNTILDSALTDFAAPNSTQTGAENSSALPVKEKDHKSTLADILVKTALEQKIAVDTATDKKSSSRFSAYHLIAAIGGIGILAGIIASLKHPEKATQLLEAFTDRMAQLLQSARNYASSYQNNPINGIAA
jgi:hypothetical protein